MDAASRTDAPITSVSVEEPAPSSSKEDRMAHAHDFTTVTLTVKHNKDRIVLDGLPPSTSILQVKEMIQQQTRILPKRQKLVGLAARIGGTKGVNDELPLSELQIKGRQPAAVDRIVSHSCILMGTPEEKIFVDPGDRDDLPDVIDDFELDFTAGSDEWMQHAANEANLRDFTEKTLVHIMNPPRDGKPLLVLDLDHTLMDFSSQGLQQQQPPPLPTNSSGAVPPNPLSAASDSHHHDAAATMKRPFMNEFLTTCYRHYDLVVWSQTSWRWLETKLTELGMITHPGYKFAFVLDKTSMFKVTSTKRDGTSVTHSVKPLQLIWSKFPRWGAHNTVHVDDLSRNFALNLGSGLKVSAYFRKKSSARRDSELLALARYLEDLALSGATFDKVDFRAWPDVVSGKRPLLREDSNTSRGR